jgi:CDGSH-type Zn-finger protein
MLHLMLAANVLNAVGGAPSLDHPGFIPRYPAYLPHSAERFLVPIARFSPDSLETFLQIERPEEAEAQPEDDRYETIGQFYRAIEDGLDYLCATLGEDAVFTGDPLRQITPELVTYGGSGKVISVTDLASARAAIDEIEEQGEGLKHAEIWDGDRDMFHPDRDEVAHYFRFVEVREGRSYQRGDTPVSGPTGDQFEVDWDAVYPMRENPRSDDFAEGSLVRMTMDAFNQTYSDLLRTMHRAFNGEQSQLLPSIGQMFQLRDLAHELMEMPTGDGETTAGPSFEYLPPRDDEDAGEVAPAFRIRVEKDGPYVVEGGVPLLRKSIVYSEWGEPLTWRTGERIPTSGAYRLCRCGGSGRKPFCDGTHRKIHFDGEETATTEPSASRQKRFEGTQITMTDDRPLCVHAGFCGNRVRKVWDMIGDSEDSIVRFQLMQMVERCPSGRLAYELADGPIEPDLPQEVAVTQDGPLWVTGGIPVELSDGRTLEVRNRVTLCRCGHSSNKPLCDGTHDSIGFKDG